MIESKHYISVLLPTFNCEKTILSTLESIKWGDEIIVIDKGKVIQKGPPGEIYNNPTSKKVALLFGKTNFIPLKMLPDSKNYFFDDETKESWISIRPNQFIIYDEITKYKGKIYIGKIKSVKRLASELKLELKCDNLLLNISLNTLTGINKHLAGATLTVWNLFSEELLTNASIFLY